MYEDRKDSYYISDWTGGWGAEAEDFTRYIRIDWERIEELSQEEQIEAFLTSDRRISIFIEEGDRFTSNAYDYGNMDIDDPTGIYDNDRRAGLDEGPFEYEKGYSNFSSQENELVESFARGFPVSHHMKFYLDSGQLGEQYQHLTDPLSQKLLFCVLHGLRRWLTGLMRLDESDRYWCFAQDFKEVPFVRLMRLPFMKNSVALRDFEIDACAKRLKEIIRPEDHEEYRDKLKNIFSKYAILMSPVLGFSFDYLYKDALGLLGLKPLLFNPIPDRPQIRPELQQEYVASFKSLQIVISDLRNSLNEMNQFALGRQTDMYLHNPGITEENPSFRFSPGDNLVLRSHLLTPVEIEHRLKCIQQVITEIGEPVVFEFSSAVLSSSEDESEDESDDQRPPKRARHTALHDHAATQHMDGNGDESEDEEE